MARRGILSVWVVTGIFVLALSTLACGGAATGNFGISGETSGEGESMGDAATANPKAQEAKQRCEQEIEKAKTKPETKLSAIQVRACLYALKPQIDACAKGPKVEVITKLVVSASGAVVNAFPIGDTADTDAAKCVAEVVLQAVFPRFTGAEQQVIKYPFTLER